MAKKLLGNIKGPKGEPGPAGPKGATGPAGEKGTTGPAGPAGKDGITPTFEVDGEGNLYVVTPDEEA